MADAATPTTPATSEAAPDGARPAAATPADALDLKGKIDRFGDILTKTLDLAEIGMNLSVSLFSTISAVAQQKIAEKLMDTGDMPPAGPPPAAAPAVSPPAAPASADPGAPPAFGITNRLRLVPGGTASIPFSVNNESAASAKQVTLHVEGFAGDRSLRFLPPDTLRVSPATRMISPMDFEKFILAGTVPADAVPDIYRGAVVVASDDIIRIPVWLVIDPAGVET
jgi:hypothetical protein